MISNVGIFGMYFAPFAVDVVTISITYLVFRRLLSKFNVFQVVWHPNLFEFSLYVCLLCSFMLVKYS